MSGGFAPGVSFGEALILVAMIVGTSFLVVKAVEALIWWLS